MAEAYALASEADLMLCVGSSLEVYPVAGLPRVTLEAGGNVALVTQGRADEALGHFEQLVRLDARDPDALNGLGVALTVDSRIVKVELTPCTSWENAMRGDRVPPAMALG